MAIFEVNRPLLRLQRHLFESVTNQQTEAGKDSCNKSHKKWLAQQRTTAPGLAWHRDVMRRAMAKYRAKKKAQQEERDHGPEIDQDQR